MADEGVLLSFACDDGHRSVVVEDDGVVGWAYLLVDKKIVSDVWLYNAGKPIKPVDRTRPPRNPQPPAEVQPLDRFTHASRIECEWITDGAQLTFTDGPVFARLVVGAKPGWSSSVCVASAFARPLQPVVSAKE